MAVYRGATSGSRDHRRHSSSDHRPVAPHPLLSPGGLKHMEVGGPTSSGICGSPTTTALDAVRAGHRSTEPEPRRSRENADWISVARVTPRQEPGNSRLEQSDQLRIHEVMLVRDVQTDHASIRQVAPKWARELGAVRLFHDENEVRPFHVLGSERIVGIFAQTRRGTPDRGGPRTPARPLGCAGDCDCREK